MDCSNRPAPCLSFPRCSHPVHDWWETDAHRGSGIGSARRNALVGLHLPSLSAGGPNPSHRAVGAAGPGRAPAGPGLYASPSSASVTVSEGREAPGQGHAGALRPFLEFHSPHRVKHPNTPERSLLTLSGPPRAPGPSRPGMSLVWTGRARGMPRHVAFRDQLFRDSFIRELGQVLTHPPCVHLRSGWSPPWSPPELGVRKRPPLPHLSAGSWET